MAIKYTTREYFTLGIARANFEGGRRGGKSARWACLNCTDAVGDRAMLGKSVSVTHLFHERCPMSGLTFDELQANYRLGARDIARPLHWLADTWLGPAWGYTKLVVVKAVS